MHFSIDKLKFQKRKWIGAFHNIVIYICQKNLKKGLSMVSEQIKD